MSYFLFVDESGHDGSPPYEVLAGVAIEDRDLWNCILAVHALEEQTFGRRISQGGLELKGKKLLKNKTFKHAKQMEVMMPEEMRQLALACLKKGDAKESITRRELTALAQAKIAFVRGLIDICANFRVKAFASIVDKDAPRAQPGKYLRKDYAFLFERYFYFLEDKKAMGTIVFDELEKSRCHILIGEMECYFLKTTKGRARSSSIIPEPMFVHSDLTTAIQLADIVAYIISWGVRIPGKMTRPAREELKQLAEQILCLRYSTNREGYTTWSFVPINDLRPSDCDKDV
ncbi:MAG: DUF3800 domain-containing protein [Planctomycetota bacterium]|jgi:hypothetical protein|nr:DUF3800 domain-containing protein [Planctomycetota bacterium]